MFSGMRLAQARLASRKSFFGMQPNRGFATMTDECAAHLRSLGITNKNVVYNPT